MMSTAAFAQSAEPARKHHHHETAAGASDRLDLLEKRIEQQAQEISDLKSQLNQGSGEVSSQQFQALQSQVFETQAAVKSASAAQAAVVFKPSQPSFHQKARITISSPDGRYTFSPIATVQGDFASYSKGQPLG
ncbi:MAG TPA: hypothetical protein VKB71_02285, partial [Rhizomicrobium sp.]|nr:hypothetical protein [Rhizomicrobium sp.]